MLHEENFAYHHSLHAHPDQTPKKPLTPALGQDIVNRKNSTNKKEHHMAHIEPQQQTTITVTFNDTHGSEHTLTLTPDEYLKFAHALQDTIHAELTQDVFTDDIEIHTQHHGKIIVARYRGEEEEYIDMYISNHPNMSPVAHLDMEDAWQIVDECKSIALLYNS